MQQFVRLHRGQFVPSGGSAHTVELKEMSYWKTGEITQKLSFCLCMWGGRGVKVQCHKFLSTALTPRTEVSAYNGQDAVSAHGLSQRGSRQNDSAAAITCTLSCRVRRHSSWLMAQKQDIPEVKNRVGQAHG